MPSVSKFGSRTPPESRQRSSRISRTGRNGGRRPGGLCMGLMGRLLVGKPVGENWPVWPTGLPWVRASGTNDADRAVTADQRRADGVQVGARQREVTADDRAVGHVQGAGVEDAAARAREVRITA